MPGFVKKNPGREEALERRIRDLLAAGDLAGAATQVIQGYGPEVLGFLAAYVGDEDDASEALAQASFDLWSSIRNFHQHASLRTWFYTLARHAAARLRRAAHRRPGRHLSIDEVPEISAADARSATAPYLRSEIKNGYAAIRDALSPGDRALLILRVDRRMSWQEIARILGSHDDGDGALARRAARLRKRFQLLKVEIRERARAAGLLEDG
jgi:RNA polymerase sigma-70 factor, ECF subfamily